MTTPTATLTTPLATTMDSPIGPLILTGLPGLLTGLQMAVQAHATVPVGASSAAREAFRAVIAQLEAYFAGKLRDFDVPLQLVGTEFQQKV